MKLTIRSFKIIYNLSKGRTKQKKVHCVSGGRMSEEDFLKAMEEVKTLNIKL